ncbi:MAG: hypothetical protein AAFX50_13565, partial [Acidobacteriota bacterium]
VGLRVDGEPLWRRIALESQVEGLSLDSAATGRVAIWRRVGWILEDAPGLGVGPGGVGPALRLAYPGTPEVDHAHQLALHTAAALGLPAGLLLLVAVGRAGWLLARHPAGALLGRRRRAAVAGAGAAFLVFGLADTLPLTDLRGLFAWPLLALALRATAPPRPRAPARALARPAGVAAGLLAGLVAIAASAERPAVRAVAELASGDPSAAVPALDDAARSRPRLEWLRGLLAHRAGRTDDRDASWRRVIGHGPDRLALLAAVGAGPELGRAAVERWPGHADAWRLRARAAPDVVDARAAWRRVVEIAPWDGRAWLALGDLDVASNPDDALGAYARACVEGDPGANACLRGGRLAESLGAPIRARALFRRSRYAPVRALGDQPLR